MKNGYNILEKYCLFERYSVDKERHVSIYGEMSTIKYIVKLNKKFRERGKFITHLFSSLYNYDKGKRRLNPTLFLDDMKKFQRKILQKRNSQKYELSTISEENNSSLSKNGNLTNNII